MYFLHSSIKVLTAPEVDGRQAGFWRVLFFLDLFFCLSSQQPARQRAVFFSPKPNTMHFDPEHLPLPTISAVHQVRPTLELQVRAQRINMRTIRPDEHCTRVYLIAGYMADRGEYLEWLRVHGRYATPRIRYAVKRELRFTCQRLCELYAATGTRSRHSV